MCVCVFVCPCPVYVFPVGSFGHCDNSSLGAGSCFAPVSCTASHHRFRVRSIFIYFTSHTRRPELVRQQEEINKAFKRFKAVADSGKAIVDQDLHAIVRDELHQPAAILSLKMVRRNWAFPVAAHVVLSERFETQSCVFSLAHWTRQKHSRLIINGAHARTVLQLMVSSGSAVPATATVGLVTPEGEERTEAAVGVGPINAIFQSICRAANVEVELVDFTVKSITGGTDALGEVMVAIKAPGRHEVRGRSW